MSAVNANEIELAYEAACRVAREENDGVLDEVTRMALVCCVNHLLESLISEQRNYSHAAERRVTEGKAIQARIVGEGSP